MCPYAKHVPRNARDDRAERPAPRRSPFGVSFLVPKMINVARWTTTAILVPTFPAARCCLDLVSHQPRPQAPGRVRPQRVRTHRRGLPESASERRSSTRAQP